MHRPISPDTREAVGVITSVSDLEALVDDLLTHGFDRSEISMLASVDTVERKLGDHFRSVRALEDDDAVPTTEYVPRETIGDAMGAVIGGLVYVGALASMIPIVASGAGLAAMIFAASAGGLGGGAVGTYLAMRIQKDHRRYYEQQLERGGILLWVRVWDEEDEKRALDIMRRHGADDVHAHGPVDEH